jgi:hypothetical protein
VGVTVAGSIRGVLNRQRRRATPRAARLEGEKVGDILRLRLTHQVPPEFSERPAERTKAGFFDTWYCIGPARYQRACRRIGRWKT